MHIYQRLKELDPKTFEQFCVQLLKERHPGLDIKHVDGSAGGSWRPPEVNSLGARSTTAGACQNRISTAQVTGKRRQA